MAHDFTLTSLHGAGSTTIQDNSGGTSPVISVANGSNDTISNLTVEGHNGTYAPAGIAVTNTNGIAITGNTVQDVDGAAISVDPSSNVTIQSNIVYDAWTGISVSGLTGTNLIDSNAIDNISFDAIDASGNTGLTISNNQIGNQGAKLIGGAGIYVSGDDDVTISANTVNHAVTGITVTGLTDSSGLGNNLISGNTVDYVSGDGIDASYSTGLNITGNFIGQNGSVSGTGISLYNSNFAQVTNNQINGAPTGISVAEDTGLDNEGSHDINITGNTISNASTGITADETYNLNINDNTLTGITGTGIAITDSEGEGASGGDNYNININGNTITGSAGAVGIDVANASGVTIGSVNALQLGPIGDQDGHDLDGDADDFSNIISGFATGIKVTGGNTVSVAYNSVDPGTTGISVDHSAFVTVDTNTVNGFNTGISATSSDTVAVTNNTVTNSGTGIYVNSLTDSIGSGNQVAGNQIDFTTGDAIDAYSSANLWIGNNLIGQNGGGIGVYGIYVNQLSNGIGGNSSVTGNTIDNTGNNAIYASFDTNLAINNNVIGTHGGANNIGTGGYANGIVVYRDDDVNVNGNTVQNVQGGSGIVVDSLTDLGGNGNYIIGNNIDFVVGDGIDALSNASGSVNLGISGNQIGQNGGGIGGYGIYATGLTYDSAGNSSITGNTIDHTGGDGIRTSYDNQLAINGNYIGTVAGAGSIGGDGINSYWETNINIDNNHIQNTAAYGILAQYLWDSSGAGNNILGNTIDFTVYDGIYANYGYNVGIGNSQIGQNGGGIGGNGITVLNLFADLAGNSSVTNNVIDNTTYDGINAAYDQYLAINGNQIGTNAGNIGGNGISVFDDSALTVYNNTVHNTTGGGIVVDLLYGTYGGNVIDTNYVESTGGNGISASNSGPLTISNNQIGQNGSGSITGDGIHAENDYNVQITGNQVDPVGDGIYVSGSDYAYIYNNEVKHASLNGIEVNNSYNPTIDSNGVFRNSGD
ncbi:MAG: right-handed parallel beta-helix repeat-containing protein, partial [Alphaproteobacteria bacterium]|nr:right-handed parallel beta-helix repeat-containing protein [Alphaproteobacteria bacterium]